MGGRNKPSLDVMQAILRRFRAVSCDWLIMGVGSMYVSGAREEGVLPLFDNDKQEETASVANETVEEKKPMMAIAASRTVSKIMVFYSDGTFEER